LLLVMSYAEQIRKSLASGAKSKQQLMDDAGVTRESVTDTGRKLWDFLGDLDDLQRKKDEGQPGGIGVAIKRKEANPDKRRYFYRAEDEGELEARGVISPEQTGRLSSLLKGALESGDISQKEYNRLVTQALRVPGRK
jgi:hypothetical protein